MTIKRDLKRRVRERQTRTGESYVTALRQVRAHVEPAVPVIELADLSAEAARVGLRCRVHLFPELAARVDGIAAVTRLRDVLIATDEDPATRLFRAVALRGEPVHLPPRSLGAFEAGRRFLARCKAGLGGVSEGGGMLGLHVGAELVVCLLWLAPAPLLAGREPAVVLTTADGPYSAWQPWRLP